MQIVKNTTILFDPYFLFYNHCFKNNKTQGGVPWVLYYLSSRAKRILYTCYFA